MPRCQALKPGCKFAAPVPLYPCACARGSQFPYQSFRSVIMRSNRINRTLSAPRGGLALRTQPGPKRLRRGAVLVCGRGAQPRSDTLGGQLQGARDRCPDDRTRLPPSTPPLSLTDHSTHTRASAARGLRALPRFYNRSTCTPRPAPPRRTRSRGQRRRFAHHRHDSDVQ